jgi:hypothetical protein
MMNIEMPEVEEYLRKLTCRGCGNHCSLSDPNCGRSKIYIADAIEKYNEQLNKEK